MIAEALTLMTSLAALAMAFGVLVLPNSQRAARCLLGLSAALAAFLIATESTPPAWAVVLAGVSICTVFANQDGEPSGWQNWFVIVVASSTLWLLSLFLIWTLEEALVLPTEATSLPASVAEVLRLALERFFWPLLLMGFVLLAACVGGMRLMQSTEGEENV